MPPSGYGATVTIHAPEAAPWVEHMRAVASTLLHDVDRHAAEMITALEGVAAHAVVADPGLRAALQESATANVVHWLSQVVVDPTIPISPARNRAAMNLARDLVRRGHDSGVLDGFRTGQNISWRIWMGECCRLGLPPDELGELLDRSATSMFAYVDTSIATIEALIRAEMHQLTHGTAGERLAIVRMVLDGEPWSVDEASERLAHDLRAHQTAVLLWRDPLVGDAETLKRVADGVARSAGLASPLTVAPTVSSLWAWYATDSAVAVHLFEEAVDQEGVHVAIGSTARGIDGFRTSHGHALDAQRVVMDASGGPKVAAFADVQVVALVAGRGAQAFEFVARTLGSLARADPVLRETLRTYLRCDSNASATARKLFTHRNTVLKRLARAETLLPGGLEGRSLEVGVALEVLHWQGPDSAEPQS